MTSPLQWVKRLVGRGAAADAPPGPARTGATPPVAAAAPSPAAKPPAQGAPAVAPGFGARRPLVAASGEVAGFEFRMPASLERRLEKSGGVETLGAHAIALLAALKPTLDSGRLALASVPAALLARAAVFEQVPAGLLLLVPGRDPASDEQRIVLDALRRRGVKIGLATRVDEPVPAAGELADIDFVALSVVAAAPAVADARTPAEQLADRIAAWRLARPTALLIATELPDIDALEQVLKAGVSHACGRVEPDGAARQIKPLQAGVQRLCQMLNDVMLDRDTVQLASTIRADVGLSYRMLRYANSPAVGLKSAVESIEQAVSLLGRNELYRWLSLMLLAAGDGRRTSRALQEIALSRARLLELLARGRGDAPPDALFTVGLLSLLDAMLQVPLEQALKPLNLAGPAREALLEQTGPWQPYLALAAALEQQDTAAAEPLAEAHGGLEAVLALADEAWRWAADIGATTRENRPAPAAAATAATPA